MWRELEIINDAGLRLAALHCVPEGEVERGERPLLIVCHGFLGSKEGGGGAVAMAERVLERGYDVLLFDFTGSGESEGEWEEITLSRQVADLGAVVKYARAEGYQRIILNGRSFGGATVIAYAATDPEIEALTTWAAVAEPAKLFAGLVEGGLPAKGEPDERVALRDAEGSIYVRRRFFIDAAEYDLVATAAEIAPRPFFIIHGTADESVPPADAELLFRSAGEGRKLALMDGADHVFSEHQALLWQHLFRWLDELQLKAE